MADTVVCSFCGTVIAYNKACIGFGIEKPISESHYFCDESHRSEFIVRETARERGIEHTMRVYVNKGRELRYGSDLTEEDMKAFEQGEIVKCLDENGMEVQRLIMDPFGDLKEY